MAGIFLILALPAMSADRIGAIDFYGYGGIDIEKVRAALPVKIGDPAAMADLMKEDGPFAKIPDVVVQLTGAPPTEVSLTCCIGDRDQMLFIGLQGSTFREPPSRPEPTGGARLPASMLALYDRLMAALFQTVTTNSTEDRSKGYALAPDEPLRSVQLELREWAAGHEAEILAAMESREVEHRRAAAQALGYVDRSARQIEALAQATEDPDATVRNNATRALDVLVASDPALVRTLDPRHFVAMLRSGSFSDRNKAVWMLDQTTAIPNEPLLALLRAESVDALREMAAWTSQPHGEPARKILERLGER